MPILSDITRKLHLLTTDAIPDPPRMGIKGYSHNLEEKSKLKLKTKNESSSEPTTPNEQLEHRGVTERQKSVPNDAIPTEYPKESDGERKSPSTERKEQKKPGTRTRTKSKQYKSYQGTNVVNYNIVNSNGVNIGSRTSYICNVNQQTMSTSGDSTSTRGKFRVMTEEIERLKECTEEISLDDIFVIKTHVGHGWRDVARRLSYSDGQIEQFEENYKHRGVDEVIYQLLLDWKQANTKEAELGRIVAALWTCQEYDCVDRLVIAHSKTS